MYNFLSRLNLSTKVYISDNEIIVIELFAMSSLPIQEVVYFHLAQSRLDLSKFANDLKWPFYR